MASTRYSAIGSCGAATADSALVATNAAEAIFRNRFINKVPIYGLDDAKAFINGDLYNDSLRLCFPFG
jgi:hypothetical protein